MPRAKLRFTRTARIVVIGLALLPAGASHAQFGFLYEWNKPAGGAYAVNANWTPSGVPDASNEAAYFGLNSTYNVQLPTSDVTVSSLEVAQGVVGLTYSPSGMPATTYTANGSLTVGSTGQALLRLVRAGQFAATPRLTTGAATLGVNPGSDGQLRMLSGMWTAGATVIGAAGSGHFELSSAESHATATTAGAVLGQAATGSGTANVSGTWNSGDLIVGDAGDAVVNIGVGSTFIAARLNSGSASIAAKNGSIGTVNVTGLDISQFPPRASDWHVAGSLAIGGDNASPGGVGRLLIGTLNEVAVGSDLKIWPGGTLSLRESGVFTVSGAANLSGALEFSLFQTINPTLGAEFQILTAASVAGTFSSTMLPPLANGLRWAVDYEATSVSLRVAPAFTADFDDDGDVDAADLAQWQGDFGSTPDSDADADGDSDGDDFLAWQRQLGSPAPAISAAAAVPEPGSAALMAVALYSVLALKPPRRVFLPPPSSRG